MIHFLTSPMEEHDWCFLESNYENGIKTEQKKARSGNYGTVKAGNFVWSPNFVHLYTEYLKINMKSCFTDSNFFQKQTGHCIIFKVQINFMVNIFTECFFKQHK